MNSGRGTELTHAGGPVALDAGWLARLWVGSARRLLRGFDAGIVQGSIDLTLPDGSRQRLGGRNPGIAAQLTLNNWSGLVRGASAGSVGLFKSWEAGEWDSADLAGLFAVLAANSAHLSKQLRARGPWRLGGRVLHCLHRNSRSGARRNIHAHYDLGNDFYAAWLDPEMVYSSARFQPGEPDLAAAQRRKLDSVADRVAGAHNVLEIGCGWGALAQRLAESGMAVTAISLSDAQLDWARANRPSAIDFCKQDYRDAQGQFDAIVSVEMVEAVGQEYWDAFFAAVARCLKPGGRAAIQYIAIRDDLFEAYAQSADFIQTYIFPGGMLVSESRFRALAALHGLDWQDQIDFPLDYAETLRIWLEKFDLAVSQGRLPDGFDHRFVRMWRFYLMYCEGGFRGGLITVAQVTLILE
ncbi:MAG: cyclopropane-fatty-acyl-phospholipid synthase family protein [Novosphingobium sp.]|uniref:class I SAM-dependent methyltransferase n=1 Tax=Novosphingobium sp. TaxID=1874826 RepID=UPI0032BAADD2